MLAQTETFSLLYLPFNSECYFSRKLAPGHKGLDACSVLPLTELSPVNKVPG